MAIDSPPPRDKIRAGQYRRPSFFDGPLGYTPSDAYQRRDPFLENNPGRYGSSGSVEGFDGSLHLGACPACRVGKLETEYSCLSICCLMFCLPINICQHKHCDHCGAYFQ